MSATIANLHEIASFLNADIYTRNFRPVELKEYCQKQNIPCNIIITQPKKISAESLELLLSENVKCLAGRIGKALGSNFVW